MSENLTDAEALTVGQYVRCAVCGQWVGPTDVDRHVPVCYNGITLEQRCS